MREILEILEDDARVSPEEIAAMVDMSPEEVQAAIREMEEKGVIRKYATIINWEKAGEDHVDAVIEVKVNPDRNRGYDLIAERIARFPEVRSLRLVSGDHDLSLLVRGRSMKEVAFFVAEKLASLEEVEGTLTHFELKCYKDHGDLLFEEENNHRLTISP